MGWVFDAELGVKRVADRAEVLTKIEPATFRGIDCALLAERYVAYRRSSGLDTVLADPDRITPATSDPANV